MTKSFEILLYYKYVRIDNPQYLLKEHKELCEQLGLKGRILIAPEGINGTVEGTVANTQKYIDTVTKDPRFSDIHFKRSVGTGNAFPKLKVKVRPEIVSLHLGERDIDPNKVTGKYLDPSELHEWFEQNKEFYIVDMRNDYEFEVGQFEGSIFPDLKNFRDLQKNLPQLELYKDKTVLTVCTGGVRCEKASGFLVENGFADVYQLKGGIVSYMEKYPNQHFLGKLYVFDGRVVMGFNTDSPEHKVISSCSKCQKPSDNYIDCRHKHCKGHRHFLCCEECLQTERNSYCSDTCYKEDSANISFVENSKHASISFS